MLISQSTSGFYKVPVSKGLILSTFITSTAIHLPPFSNLRNYLNVKIPNALLSGQFLRILFNRLTFVHTKDIICSLLVIYYFRIFERRYGSRKFASHLIGSCIIATVLEICTILFLSYFQLDYHNGGYLPPGLYSLIFPFFVNYFQDIPRDKLTSIFFIPVTGKTITYLLGLQIAASSPATIISSLCGIIGGLLYRKLFSKWLFVPKRFASICDKVFGWMLYSKEPKYNPMGATLDLQRQELEDQMEQQYIYNRAQDFRTARGQGFAERLVGNDNPGADNGLMGYFMRQRRPAGRGEPSEENIRILCEMGFTREMSVQALNSSGNDLQSATSILLRGS